MGHSEYLNLSGVLPPVAELRALSAVRCCSSISPRNGNFLPKGKDQHWWLQGRGHLDLGWLWFCSCLDLISSECCLVMTGRESRQVSFQLFPKCRSREVSHEKERPRLEMRLNK